MRWEGTSSVVMASTRVDLPEPMSPVNKPFLPPSCSVQTRLSKVPQLKTSSRLRRKPVSLSSPRSNWLVTPSLCGRGFGSCASVIGFSRLGCGQLQLVRGQPLIEIGQPLGIDKGFQDAPHLVHRLLPGLARAAALGLEASDKAEINDLV